MRRGERKAEARRLVEAFDLGGVERWAAREGAAWAVVQALLFDADPLVRWRAVEALGRVAALRARADLEGARELVRRTLWLMNDESGGLLWLGPPVIGAVLANVPPLCDEFLDVLASFLEEEPFEAGTRWALWRVALARPGAVAAAAGAALAASLGDPDPQVRGTSAVALAAAAGPHAAPALAAEHGPVVLFDPRTGDFRSTTPGDGSGQRPC